MNKPKHEPNRLKNTAFSFNGNTLIDLGNVLEEPGESVVDVVFLITKHGESHYIFIYPDGKVLIS